MGEQRNRLAHDAPRFAGVQIHGEVYAGHITSVLNIVYGPREGRHQWRSVEQRETKPRRAIQTSHH